MILTVSIALLLKAASAAFASGAFACSASNSLASTSTNVTTTTNNNQVAGAGASAQGSPTNIAGAGSTSSVGGFSASGGLKVGGGSTATINVTSSDVDALQANQAVSTDALDDLSNVSQSALSDSALTQEGAGEVVEDALGVLENVTDQYAAGVAQTAANSDVVASNALQQEGDTALLTVPALQAIDTSNPTGTDGTTFGLSNESIVVWTSIIGVALTIWYYNRKKA